VEGKRFSAAWCLLSSCLRSRPSGERRGICFCFSQGHAALLAAFCLSGCFSTPLLVVWLRALRPSYPQNSQRFQRQFSSESEIVS